MRLAIPRLTATEQVNILTLLSDTLVNKTHQQMNRYVTCSLIIINYYYYYYY